MVAVLLSALMIATAACGSSTETTGSTADAAPASDPATTADAATSTASEDNESVESTENTNTSEAAGTSIDTASAERTETFEGVLEPTWLPDGWVELGRTPIDSQLAIAYGEADDEALLTVLVGSVDDRELNLDAIRSRDPLGGELISVRGGSDNAVLVVSSEDGTGDGTGDTSASTITIAFVEEGLLYQVISDDGAFADQGRRFVESLVSAAGVGVSSPTDGQSEPTEPGQQSEPKDPPTETAPTESKGGPGDIDS